MQIATFKKEKRKRRKKKEEKKEKRREERKKKRNGDSISAVTVLSHTAVTSLPTRNQRFKCKGVTGDSKFSLCNHIVREEGNINILQFYFKL
ncbi:hypothetical protein [Bacteroides congonensis]